MTNATPGEPEGRSLGLADYIAELARDERDRPPPKFHGLRGWVLEPAINLDAERPGFLALLIGLSARHRQAVFLAFALGVQDSPGPFLAPSGDLADLRGPNIVRALADAFLGLPAREIVQRAVGIVPDGLLGALERIGLDCLRLSESYQRLLKLFMSKKARRRQQMLLARDRIDGESVALAEMLDATMLHPKISSRITRISHGLEFNAAARVIREFVSTATPDAMAKSASDLGEDTRLSEWLCRWLLNADRFPDAPFEFPGGELLPLRSGREMANAGRAMRNCLGTKILTVLAGRNFYYVWRGSPAAVAVLTRLADGGWLLGLVEGRLNEPPGHEAYEAIRARFEPLGVRCAVPAPVDQRFALADAVFSRFGNDDLGEGVLAEVGQFR